MPWRWKATPWAHKHDEGAHPGEGEEAQGSPPPSPSRAPLATTIERRLLLPALGPEVRQSMPHFWSRGPNSQPIAPGGIRCCSGLQVLPFQKFVALGLFRHRGPWVRQPCAPGSGDHGPRRKTRGTLVIVVVPLDAAGHGARGGSARILGGLGGAPDLHELGLDILALRTAKEVTT